MGDDESIPRPWAEVRVHCSRSPTGEASLRQCFACAKFRGFSLSAASCVKSKVTCISGVLVQGAEDGKLLDGALDEDGSEAES